VTAITTKMAQNSALSRTTTHIANAIVHIPIHTRSKPSPQPFESAGSEERA